jgi:hypothetical protein
MEICPVEGEFFYVDRRTDVPKVIVAVHSVANAP